VVLKKSVIDYTDKWKVKLEDTEVLDGGVLDEKHLKVNMKYYDLSV